MDQIKTGKFIQELRKKKKMTQQELAEKLGVTDRSIGNWENGRNMPDLSVFIPLCDALDITVNDLLSGEIISKDKYQEKFEDNIVNTIEYSTKKIDSYIIIIGHILMVFGLFMTLTALMIFHGESSWGSIYSLIGIVLFAMGVSKLLYKSTIGKRLLMMLIVLVGSFHVLVLIDYINVKVKHDAPTYRISYKYVASDDVEVHYYNTPFYDAIKCDDGYEIIKSKKYTNEELLGYCINKK